MISYRHTQVGTLTLLFLGIGILLVVLPMAVYGFHWALLGVAMVFLILMGLFSTLTVEIAGDNLFARFGPGVVRKRFPLQEIVTCRAARNPWYYGWGIRWTPRGWLYNVSGCLAVELEMKDGKRYRVGTDDPEGLVSAIRQAVASAEGGST